MNNELTEKIEGVRAYLVSQNANISACAVDEAIAAMRSEPVAWMVSEKGGKPWPTLLGPNTVSDDDKNEYELVFTPLYAAPLRADSAEPVAGQLSAEQVGDRLSLWKRLREQRDACADALRAIDPTNSALVGIPTRTQQLENILKACEDEKELSQPPNGTQVSSFHESLHQSTMALRGTFADGIEAAAKVCESQSRNAQSIDGKSFYIATGQCAKAIRALAQGQRSPKQGMPTELSQTQVADSDHPTEQDADELLREVLDWGLPDDLKQRIDAHLSRKEQA